MTDKTKLYGTTKKQAESAFINTYNGITYMNPDNYDKLEIDEISKWEKVVNDCRFYYKRDPIASTVINKTVEIGITDLTFEKGDLSENEFRIFTGIEDEIREFLKVCALEYLISGLVVPEIKYAAVSKDQLITMGVKKYNSLQLPVLMWLRDPATVEIKYTLFGGEPSYFVVIPDEMIYFIKHQGRYSDGSSDPELYQKLLALYPNLIAQVEAGAKKILLDNRLIIRRKPITGNPYPTPYLYPVLEVLKHKMNLRRMDYSVASRVIAAIQLFRLGNDEYPITEDDSDAFDDIKNQMQIRDSSAAGNYPYNLERIFQLFANHTLQIEWIMPDISALVDDRKYAVVNQDIFYGLGFPKILTTGETERSQVSNAEFAMISPTKSMEDIQEQLLEIAKDIVFNVSKLNNLKDTPEVDFEKINLYALRDFLEVMKELYNTGNISRDTYLKTFGYDFEDEAKKRSDETAIMKEYKIGEFAPQPFSPQPNNPGQPQNPQAQPKPKQNQQQNKPNNQ